MAKTSNTEANALPYAELVIRPADSRPIVITLPERGGMAEISPGNADDAVEATVILSLMMAIVKALHKVRLMAAENSESTRVASTGADDIPF